jgi:hypothetical protein
MRLEAAQSPYVFIAKCKSGVTLQIWAIGHQVSGGPVRRRLQRRRTSLISPFCQGLMVKDRLYSMHLQVRFRKNAESVIQWLTDPQRALERRAEIEKLPNITDFS